MRGGKEVQGLGICCPWFCLGILQLITRLSAQQHQLCVLGYGKAPLRHRPATEGHPVGENTSGGSYFLPDLKILQGQHFLEQFFNFLFLFPSSYGLIVIAGRVPALETPRT